MTQPVQLNVYELQLCLYKGAHRGALNKTDIVTNFVTNIVISIFTISKVPVWI